MIHKVETWVDNPVFGDLKVEALYTDYKDFTGVKFPTTIINKQDGRNTLILVVNEVKPNAPVTIQAPPPAAGGARRAGGRHRAVPGSGSGRLLSDGRQPPQRGRRVRGPHRRD